MKNLLLAFLLSFSAYGQNKVIVHINAEFNSSNDWNGLEALKGVKLYNGYIESNPAIKEKYNIHKVPTVILFQDSKEVYRWEAGLDMKLHATLKEIQQKIDKNE
tara:strand:- start:815 stop:1126 length:312 start_codon:yes stop_codon:yes gene_type:complete